MPTQWQYIVMMSISRSTVYRLQLYNVLTTKAIERYKTILCLTKSFEEVITGSQSIGWSDHPSRLLTTVLVQQSGCGYARLPAISLACTLHIYIVIMKY